MLMEAATHEFGHFVDDVSTKGVIGSQLTDASRFFPKKADDLQGHLLYRNSPKEQSSFVIGSTVGNRFFDMLQQTLDTGKVPTTTFSKIDDFKIQHALAGHEVTLVDNVNDSYFFMKAKPENISGLSDYFKQKGLRVETTSDGVKIFENINPITDATRATTNAATDGARTANATADAARATNTASNNYTLIQQSLVKRLNEEMCFVGNTNDSHLIGLRNEYLQKISTVANEQEANALWLKYHDDIIDYASKQFDPYKARGIAIGRRHEYMNIIKNDPDLLAKVKKWSTLSDADKEDVLAIILLKTDTPVDISITRTGVGGSTDYNTGNIELSLNSGHVFGSNGRTHIIKPSESFDDAITAMAHEHTHAILVNNPTKSSVPEDMVKTVILHNEDEKGVTSYRGMRSSMNNYLNQIQEKEAFYMSEIIGNGFTQDLLK